MRISIVGAYGYTGNLICEELTQAGISFSIFGRNKEKLLALKNELTTVSTAESLDMRRAEDVQKLIDCSDLIVNCAGPFTEESKGLVNSAAENGKIYLDISGEIGFVRDSHERNNSIALKSQALIVHGCAFESLVADLVIQPLLKNAQGIESIRSFYWFNQKRVSPGTRVTMKLSRFRKLLKISKGEWAIGDAVQDQIQVTSSSSDSRFVAVPYPLPEVAYCKWNIQPKNAESFLLLNQDEAMFVGLRKNEGQKALTVLDKIRKSKPNGPSKVELEGQRSILAIEIKDENGLFTLTVNAINMYQTTAISIRLAIQALQNNSGKLAGVLSPARLFEGIEKETLTALKVSSNLENPFIIADV
ncbi:MAG: saccharopine dehydrogenase NADP-binding domain-containing protein [Salibacteraceae bacterium]